MPAGDEARMSFLARVRGATRALLTRCHYEAEFHLHEHRSQERRVLRRVTSFRKTLPEAGGGLERGLQDKRGVAVGFTHP